MESTLRFGSFCTAVLRTSDPQRAAGFYASLIGWTTHPAATDHTFFQFNGKTVASIQRTSAFPLYWVPHVVVEDIDRTTGAALALGGKVVDATHVPGVARMVTLQDREHAVFGLWQPDPHRGAEQTDVLGSIWWIELLSKDPAAARDFYGRLFGWTARDTSIEPVGLYTVFERGATQEGGLLEIEPEWDLSPLWATIVSVEDCDRALERTPELGGTRQFIHTVPTHGRIGGVTDSNGAYLSLRGPVPATT